ncbi:hypothetical protein KBD08_02205 [Candidatus Babeliales bacterium]|nr:hypothetical protein [Candidatus Babeliales bacterium]
MLKLSIFKTTYSLLLFICFTVFTICPLQREHPEIVTSYLLQILNEKTTQAEGLVGSTLVKIVDGYEAIATLQNNDTICGHSDDKAQRVILNQSVPVSYVFEIQLETTTIVAAPKQQLYDTLLQTWVYAQDLTRDNCIGDQQVISSRKLRKITTVYQLTTEYHIFTIENDQILVHNANIASMSNLSLIFGACSCAHPVVAAIGRTISLAKMAMSMYEMYQDAQSHAQNLLSAMQEEEVVQATRSYYEMRRKDLLHLLEQYRTLKQAVMALAGQSTNINFLFTTIATTQINQSLLPSLQSELTYSATDKQKLLQLRQQELDSIETEINSIQITLMLHLQDQADRLTNALAQLDPAYNTVQQNLKVQIPYHNRNAANNIATQHYASLLTLLEAVENVEHKLLILQRLIQYYQHPSNAQMLKHSTNIIALCAEHQLTINQTNKFLPNLKKYAQASQQSAYQSLTQSGLLSQQAIIAIQRNLQIHRNETEHGHNAHAKIKQAQVIHATPPNDPDPEDDIDEKTYDDTKNKLPVNQNSLIHIFKPEEGI